MTDVERQFMAEPYDQMMGTFKASLPAPPFDVQLSARRVEHDRSQPMGKGGYWLTRPCPVRGASAAGLRGDDHPIRLLHALRRGLSFGHRPRPPQQLHRDPCGRVEALPGYTHPLRQASALGLSTCLLLLLLLLLEGDGFTITGPTMATDVGPPPTSAHGRRRHRDVVPLPGGHVDPRRHDQHGPFRLHRLPGPGGAADPRSPCLPSLAALLPLLPSPPSPFLLTLLSFSSEESDTKGHASSDDPQEVRRSRLLMCVARHTPFPRRLFLPADPPALDVVVEGASGLLRRDGAHDSRPQVLHCRAHPRRAGHSGRGSGMSTTKQRSSAKRG